MGCGSCSHIRPLRGLSPDGHGLAPCGHTRSILCMGAFIHSFALLPPAHPSELK